MAKAEYPKFYRKEGLCLRRDSDTVTIEIKVPLEGNLIPLSHLPVTYPSKERLDAAVAAMEPVDQGVYESYLGAWFAQSRENEKRFNDSRQVRYEAGTLKL